jgi:2-polyprenyl-6-methoxyphenol hydroxylase-like FAD-dependent oxidoreductase
MLVRFERRLVTTFGHGHTWLAGDAAHLAGPVGVQSMNAGLAEARVLADALAQPTSRDERLKQLHHYNEAARRHWRHLLGLTGKNEAEPDADPIIRQYRHELLACLPATGAALTNLAAALRLRVDPVHFEIPFVYAGG